MTDLAEAARYLREIEQEARTADAIKRLRAESRAKLLEKLGVIAGLILLCIAMSDGPWFPWVNLTALIGLVILIQIGKRKGVL